MVNTPILCLIICLDLEECLAQVYLRKILSMAESKPPGTGIQVFSWEILLLSEIYDAIRLRECPWTSHKTAPSHQCSTMCNSKKKKGGGVCVCFCTCLKKLLRSVNFWPFHHFWEYSSSNKMFLLKHFSSCNVNLSNIFCSFLWLRLIILESPIPEATICIDESFK